MVLGAHEVAADARRVCGRCVCVCCCCRRGRGGGLRGRGGRGGLRAGSSEGDERALGGVGGGMGGLGPGAAGAGMGGLGPGGVPGYPQNVMQQASALVAASRKGCAAAGVWRVRASVSVARCCSWLQGHMYHQHLGMQMHPGHMGGVPAGMMPGAHMGAYGMGGMPLQQAQHNSQMQVRRVDASLLPRRPPPQAPPWRPLATS